MYNNQRSRQIMERDYAIWNHQSWPSRFNAPKRWMVWEWLLNWDATDSLGLNNGTPTNMAWVDSWVGYTKQAGSFNGTNAYISIPDIDYNIATSFSYNAWINVNNYSDNNWIIQHDKWSVTASRWTLFRTNQTTWTLNFIRLNSWWSVITNLSSWTAVWTWTWVMVTATFNSTIGSKIFINWLQVASDSVLTATNNPTCPIWIWTLDVSVWTQNAMDWYIKYCRIFNYDLTNDDIINFYKEWLKLLH